jgi:hypothetical protein
MQYVKKQDNKQKQTVHFKNFDASKLIINQLEDNKYNTAQKLSMVRYKFDNYSESLCQLQTHDIKLFTYGIPRPGPYYKDDASRSYVKIPEDTSNPASVTFFNKMEQIDMFLQTPESKKKLFGSEKVAANYKYQPIVRCAQEKDDEDEEDLDDSKTKKQYTPGPRFIKVKIDLDWETKNIKSKVFVKDEEGKRVPVTGVTDLDEFNKYVRYQSNVCIVMILNKLYSSKNKVGETKKYGATFKISQIVCESPSTNYTVDDVDAFIDYEEENTTQLSSVKITTDDTESPNLNDNSVKISLNSHLDDDEEEEDEDEEDEEDEEDDDEPVVEKKASAQPAAKGKVPVKRRQANA